MHRYFSWLFLLLPALGCGGPSSPTSAPGTPTQTGVAGTADSPIRVYFTRPDGSPQDPNNIAHALAGYIAGARKSIDVCCFELNNQVITEALVNAVRRGVTVRLVTETDNLRAPGVGILQGVGVPVVDDQRQPLMHNKFMVFDNRAVWTGSMNFTENCAYHNDNNGMYFDDATLAANYATKFSWMFDRHAFGALPERSARIPNPVVKLRDGTVVENYFSTHDHIADHLIEKIGPARQSIHFLAFSFTHRGIGQAMLARAAAGVEVQGVFEKSQAVSGYSEFTQFQSYGPPVQVYLDANPKNMHHKVIILDGDTTVAGSFNFSDGADKHNDENVVIIHNRQVAATFEAEFQRVYGLAKGGSGTGGTLVGLKKTRAR